MAPNKRINIICHPSEYALRWSGIDLKNSKKCSGKVIDIVVIIA